MRQMLISQIKCVLNTSPRHISILIISHLKSFYDGALLELATVDSLLVNFFVFKTIVFYPVKSHTSDHFPISGIAG